ncbi:iron-containing redox enzyme family protein [Halioxenophilus sp. WMMB6]|uniref:TenA family transcriptional regulator n=1 Tax=Halioxenophilus sp. WMMB6 TaxID=3073815 RepID=UPI00295E6C1C|nr:iron-containing redox enzyme family protein [Halioxenophilus sp. WMMB6]
MSFYEQLQTDTAREREYLMSAPIIGRAMQQEVVLEEYVAFLAQAYHHVKHTVPLLMATGARIGFDQEWLREAIAEYIEEETGHQQWILNDIEHCGFDGQKVAESLPNFATELMVAYAHDTINRVNPLGFFGMVQVLEGTSIQIADYAADAIQSKLGLPDQAFSYLRSHGALDQEHVKFFANLMDRIESEADRRQILHCAKRFYHLYGDVFRSIDADQAQAFRKSSAA